MMSDILLICLFVLMIGACIGSFLNVVALRAISNESIIFPASKCPYCNKHIKWYDNIPVFSYFFTFKGKCRNCGEKVSIQYPIVEALTSILFFGIFLYSGISVQTLLLWILISISIVICITDIKKEYIYTRHVYILIIFSIIYSLFTRGIKEYPFVIFGIIAGVLTMEIIARGSYYFIKRKKIEASEQENDEENINQYIEKNKRTFGEGDTYITSAMGAFLGWKYLLFAVFTAIIIQALLILPKFLTGLYKQKNYKLFISLLVLFFLAIAHFTLCRLFNINIILMITFIVLLFALAIYCIKLIRNSSFENGFNTIPFGPALITSMFLVYFFGIYIVTIIKNIMF